MHVAALLGAFELAPAIAAGAGRSRRARAPAEHGRPGRTIELGDRHHDRALDRQQAAIGATPFLERLELDRVRRNVGNVEAGEYFLGGLGIVVGRPADQREPGQRDERVDGRHAVRHEVVLDRRAGVEAAREGRDDAQALRLERGDDAIVVARIPGEHVRAQHQQTHGASRLALRRRQRRDLVGDATGGGRVVHADVGILDRGFGLERGTQPLARAIGVATDQVAGEVRDVDVGSGQPVLQGQEVGPHVLRGARHPAQQAWDPAQHLHLLHAGAFFVTLAALGLQLLQETERTALPAHREAPHPGELHHLGRGHRADHRVALVAARLQRVEDRREVILHEQHRRDDDVAGGNRFTAALELHRVRHELGRRVQRELEPGHLATQRRGGALRRARKMRVHRHDDDVHRLRRRSFSGRSALSHRRGFRR